MKDYQEYIRDLGLEPLGRIRELWDVFKASRNGELVTVKFGNEHVRTENKVLDRVGKVEGVVKKVSFHELGQNKFKFPVLIKRYVEGNVLSLVERKIVYPDVLVNAVNTLHEKGVAIYDLADYNIVLDPTGKPVIIDLGLCEFQDENEELFNEGKALDLRDLESILKRYT